MTQIQILFYATDKPYGEFSNFSRHPIEIGGVIWPTSEHYFQAQKFAGTPLLRTKRRGVLRNVCVALGNVGDATALPALRKASGDSEPLIAEHARWAISQIESQ